MGARPLFQPLLSSLQEQLPSELNLVAGDVEKPSSSRYSNPQAHSSASYSTALSTSPSPDKGPSCPVFYQAGGACRRGEAAPRHFAVVAGAGAKATATEWGMGVLQEGQVRKGSGLTGADANASRTSVLLSMRPDCPAFSSSASSSVLKRGIRTAGAGASAPSTQATCK